MQVLAQKHLFSCLLDSLLEPGEASHTTTYGNINHTPKFSHQALYITLGTGHLAIGEGFQQLYEVLQVVRQKLDSAANTASTDQSQHHLDSHQCTISLQ